MSSKTGKGVRWKPVLDRTPSHNNEQPDITLNSIEEFHERKPVEKGMTRKLTHLGYTKNPDVERHKEYHWQKPYEKKAAQKEAWEEARQEDPDYMEQQAKKRIQNQKARQGAISGYNEIEAESIKAEAIKTYQRHGIGEYTTKAGKKYEIKEEIDTSENVIPNVCWEVEVGLVALGTVCTLLLTSPLTWLGIAGKKRKTKRNISKKIKNKRKSNKRKSNKRKSNRRRR